MQDMRGINDKVNVLLVDDQPAKLLANEEILRSLGENLIKASSAREALEFLLKNEAAVVLIDVCMPELDGFQLAAMIREHPRFQRTAIIFISAVQVDDVDRVRGYEMGAVDYVPVPVVPVPPVPVEEPVSDLPRRCASSMTRRECSSRPATSVGASGPDAAARPG